MIQFFFEDIDPVELNPKIPDWLNDLLITEGKKPGAITYIICSDQYLLKVNQDYLQHDYYTDIITFDYVRGKIISGDIFVSLPRIQDNSESVGTTFEEEFRRVLAHGLLHLCGYKDKTLEQQEIMRQRENFYLNLF